VTHRFFIGLLLVLSVGCQQTPPPSAIAATSALPATAGLPGTPAPAPQTPPGPGAPAPEQEPPADVKPVPTDLPEVVARVNGQPIPRAEFERAVRTVEARAGGPVPAERRSEIYRNILDQLVVYRLLAQEAGTRKVTVSDAEVEARIDQLRQQFPDEAAFAKALAEQKTTVDRLREDARNDMVVTKMLESAVGSEVGVSDQEIAAFYEQNQEQFREAESVKASHIMIRAEQQADEATRKQARERAESLLQQVRQGADFAALAKEHSQDPGSAADGGDLGFFPRGQMVPAFDAAAFTLEPGQVSEVVETPFGFHIIKVAERRPDRQVSLAEVRNDIVEFLSAQQKQGKAESFIEQLKAKSKIEILI
jgi:peptidyl-prolyl cis-trans isomerase C